MQFCMWMGYSFCSEISLEIRLKGDEWPNLLVLKLAVIYWGRQLFPLVGFLCASKLRLHQRCKFIRQWPAKNYDSEGTGAALLSVRTHYYLTHSGGPGDWWVQHDSFPSSLLHLHFATPFLPISLLTASEMTQPGLRNASEVLLRGSQKCNFPQDVLINMHRWNIKLSIK